MSGSKKEDHPSSAEDGQHVELHPPVDDDGWHASQVRDWIAVSPELSDSAIRLYMIMRALVIEKRGPVRKLTLWELCHLLPKKPVGPRERPEPSSVSRIRNLLRELTKIGLVTTPEGHRLTTSSRALAAGRGLRIRINLMPVKSYQGPRNVFDVLDEIRDAAESSARRARARELELAAAKRAEKAARSAGQISNPGGAGQISDPLGQISNPSGQKSDPHSGADLEDRVLPLSPPAQSSRSDVPPAPVRPSVQVEDPRDARTDGRGGGIEEDQEDGPVPAGDGTADHGTAEDPASAAGPKAKTAARAGGAPAGGPVRVDSSPGVDLLGAIGAAHPKLALTGPTLRDQGLMVTGLLEAGWPVPVLWEVIARPLPEPLRTTVGGVISGRLKVAASMPVPGSAAGAALVPHQAPGPDRAAPGEGRRWDDAPTPTAMPYAELERQQDQLRRGIDLNPGCEADDGLCPTLAVVGETRCALHLGWPLCPGLDGYACTVRTRTGDQCATCQEEARYARLDAALPVTATDDGTCSGHGGPCGRAAMPGDPYCARCRVASQRDRDRVVREWEAVRDAAVAAATAEEAPQEAPAPF
ncbi:hypothetical protein OG333_38695 (plasmid) [Streptomyces anulatus]|uniref:hypothetical protein n=1 Tax=Streptomyces anulatus TaxID=1892 RepID=UPI0037DC10A8|nr:hypothetical protein OG333_38695 [Streptomyces anulatus]